jgi:MFS family permease
VASHDDIFDKIRDIFSIQINRKNLIMILVPIICYIIWLIAFPLFGPIMDNYLCSLEALNIEKGQILQIFLFMMTISSLFTGFLIEKSSKKFIFIYMSALGSSVLTFLFIFVNDIMDLIPVAAILGIFAGAAPPAFGTYFSNLVEAADRGRIMGLTIAISMPVGYSFLIFSPLRIAGYPCFDLFIIGFIGLLPLTTLVVKPKDEVGNVNLGNRGRGNKLFILYSIPIILFYFVSGIILSIVIPTVLDIISPKLFFILWASPILFSSVIGGILLDIWGRKIPMILGLAIMGVSMGALGIMGVSSGSLTFIPMSIGYSIVLVSSLIVWGDLSPSDNLGLGYGVGFSLIWFSIGLGLIVSGTVFGNIDESVFRRLMFLSAISLFLSIPPLIIAKDALPRELIEKGLMDRHLKQVLRMRAEEDRKKEQKN